MNGIISNIRDRLLSAYDEDEALALAYWVIEEKSGLSRSDILVGRQIPEIDDLDSIIERLLRHEPIQYIFGHTEWMGLDLLVNASTLIPRPETAELIGLLPWSTKPLRVLDIGTGSGCIAIATKRARPYWQVSALDISPDALDIARENARRCAVDIDFYQADILNQQSTITNQKSFDLVISNPPYIRDSEKASMDENVLAHEPHAALFVPDSDPLLFYRRIAELHLAPALYLEINEALAQATVSMLKNHNYTDVEIHQDIYGKDRFITARIPE